jgi:hypothetical protein
MHPVTPKNRVILLAAVSITRLMAAPGNDELRFEQPYDISGSATNTGSFWDPALWRNLTTPAESPVLPENSNILRFYSKGYDGTPLATPAQNMTIKTAAALGFSPPVAVPYFGKLGFSGNRLRFDGSPDNPADPFGRLDAVSGLAMDVHSSSIDFDRTSVGISGLLITGTDYDDPPHSVAGSGIQLTGNVSPNYFYNLLNSGTTTISRQGAGSVSPVLLRDDAKAWLASETTYGFTMHPSKPNTGNAPVFRCESGGQLILGNVALTNPTGVVFDVDATGGASSIVAESVSSTGNLEDADPLVLFRATGGGALPPSPSLLVSQISHFFDLTGTFARASNHAWISLASEMWFDGEDNLLRVVAETGGQVTFDRIRTNYPLYFVDGSVQVDWSADDGGLIDGGYPTSNILQLNGSAHSFAASGGAEIRLPPNLGADNGATLTMNATGADTVLSCPNNFELEPRNPAGPATDWDLYNISLTDAATLRGGFMENYGGFQYPLLKAFRIVGHANPSSITASDSTVGYLYATLDDQVEVSLSATDQRHVDWTLGSDSEFTMDGGTWRPESADVLYVFQTLRAGGVSGDSHVTLTSNATAHAVTINIGEGSFGDGGPPPAFTPCTLTVNGGTTWTGSLSAATAASGDANILISGAGTTAGLDVANLGATAASMNYIPSPIPQFFINTGGTADLTVSSGAKVSVGSYTDAFGDWKRPGIYESASMVIKDGDVTIDGTSAAFIGDAEEASAVDYRDGALVVGPAGHLLGTFEVFGSAADGNDLVVAGGTVLPGFSPGEISVDGNFLMESGSLVMEVENGLPGGYDRISADQITINSGTIHILPTPNIIPSSSFTVDLFITENLDIDPSVVIEIDPALGTAEFDPETGLLTVTTSSAGTGFTQWQQANSTQGGLDADHDDDGVANGIEHFLGGAADTTGPTPLPVITRTAGVISITWTKAQDYAGVYGTDFQVETSASLSGTWDGEAEGVNVTINGNDVTYTFPSPPGNRLFARLAVTSP